MQKTPLEERNNKLTSTQYEQTGYEALAQREWSPCRAACPVHADVRGYVELIARGRFAEALDLIREVLPFPSVCGRICHHPCETECRRNALDEPIAVRELKRFVAECPSAPSEKKRKAPPTGKSVAIVGAGPAGLTAALDLVRAGFHAVVFEKCDVAGGILATAVPKYRLPAAIVQRDVEEILTEGVEVRTGVDIGNDKSMADLKEEGFEAVILATGLPNGVTLPIPGAELPGVTDAMIFLTTTSSGQNPGIGQDVLVIGGGNVAVDVARCAVRLGARTRMVCLESEDEMPAWDWEITEAVEEGIEIIHRRGPKEIIGHDGHVAGLVTKGVTSVFDSEGRFSPKYDENDLSTLECDTVIFAIGQKADLACLEGSDIACDERGRLIWDSETSQTSLPWVFACGEIVTGPGAAVEAVASARRAAQSAIAYIQEGVARPAQEPDIPKIGELPEQMKGKIPERPRQKPQIVAPEVRKKNFEEFEGALTAEAAMAEARRCMSCGAGAAVLEDKCSVCLTCLRICPFDIPVVTEVARIESALCQACGMCVGECPANAIVMKGYDVKQIRRDVAEKLSMAAPGQMKVIVFVCGHNLNASWDVDAAGYPPEAMLVILPSSSRLSVTDILHAFEEGADAVVVLGCESGACRYPTVEARLAKRVEQARRLMKEIGVEPQRVVLVQGLQGAHKEYAEAVGKAVCEIKAISTS